MLVSQHLLMKGATLVSSSFATVSEFECSDWGCRRQATQYNFRTEPSYKDKDKTMAELFAANIYCNIHAGVIKRQKNGRNGRYYQNENLVFIHELASHWDEAKQAYLDARLAAAQAARAKAEAQRAEANLQAQARFAEAWVERSTEPTYTVGRGTEYTSVSDQFRDGFYVGTEQDSWSTVRAEVRQDGTYPATIRLNSTGEWSPRKARAIAQALVLAANMADERDITNGPEVK